MLAPMRMTDMATVAQLSDDEYLSIWSALMEAPRGRRFLSEFARRTRIAETRTLLDSVQALERALVAERTRAGSNVERTAPPPEPAPGTQLRAIVDEAAEVLDSVVRINDNATVDVRKAADAIRATVEVLRDGGVRRVICDELRQQIEEILEIVAVQQIASQRTARIAEAMAALADRLDAAPADQPRALAATPLGHAPGQRTPALGRDPAPNEASEREEPKDHPAPGAAGRTRPRPAQSSRHGVDAGEIQRLLQALRS
ncbi:hypothetical protein [Chelatococcus reniformis]|uniref:Chemotaxis protein CheZ n=1 Tax=Chelatococcus reniformis TaxID=1494448 RepID=A0A916UR77_9HYPH|nr:hypothetical protein [Chelatococcus reniformis]GGC84253.1 hypothetical protein GCM10010994_47720 [Chelatococcus reniformis]